MNQDLVPFSLQMLSETRFSKMFNHRVRSVAKQLVSFG